MCISMSFCVVTMARGNWKSFWTEVASGFQGCGFDAELGLVSVWSLTCSLCVLWWLPNENIPDI